MSSSIVKSYATIMRCILLSARIQEGIDRRRKLIDAMKRNEQRREVGTRQREAYRQWNESRIT